MDLQKFNVTINKIMFSAKDSTYKILNFDVDSEYIDLTAKGNMDVEVGKKYVFSGKFMDDPKYGEFFNVTMCENPKLEDGEEIIEYLTSTKFVGVGRRSAKKIYDLFKDDTIKIIETEPNRLIEAKVSQSIVDEIVLKHEEYNLQAKLYEVLTKFNVSEYVVNNLYEFIKNSKLSNSINILKSNPYFYIKDVFGFTFNLADQIYLNYSNEFNSFLRVSNCILDIIQYSCYNTGDTKVDLSIIYDKLSFKIDITNEQYTDFLMQMIELEEIVVESDFVSRFDFYTEEFQIAENLKNRTQGIIDDFSSMRLQTEIAKQEALNEITYSDVQKLAIEKSLSTQVSIITGGPGTGKTTIIKAISEIYKKLYYNDKSIIDLSTKILLCAPTGRAAQRMKQATGFFSKTIHSALHWDPHSQKFSKNEEDKLLHDLIIIDEFSMVDIFLCNALFKAIKQDSHIIIVGDPAQLESVLPGSVLRDLLNSKMVNSISLDYVYRQGEGSSIAKLANQMNNNEKLQMINTGDMSVISRDGVLVDLVKSIVDKSYNAGYSQEDVQVLYPKYKGLNGIENLNLCLQPKTKNKSIKYNNIIFQIGDKVMQLKNNHELEIYNGDIGFVTKVFENDKIANQVAIEVDFGRLKIKLTYGELEHLTHAYAISIHKSQGSEFKVVIMPITSESKRMLTKKLIYTAITRAKDKLIIIGDLDYLQNGLVNDERERLTNLREIIGE